MSKRILFLLLLSILALQITSIKPVGIVFAERSFGDLAESTHKIGYSIRSAVTEATLVSVNSSKEYDSVVFVGDVMLGRHVETLLNRYGSSYSYGGYNLKQNSSSSAIVANFESAAAQHHIQTPALAMRFSVSPEHITSFGDHFTHASLANNHALDYKEEGYRNVTQLLEQSGVISYGHTARIDEAAVTFLDTKRGRIALIGINATSRISETSEIDSVCELAKRGSDFQVVTVHWGDEYELTHSETQRTLAEVFVDSCADLIIGHHPHVVQDIDLIKGVPVFYSLGNYIFDQYFSKDVMQGLVVSLVLEETPALSLLPVESDSVRSVPQRMGSAEERAFLAALAKRSHPSLEAAIIQGKINLFEPVATSTKIAIMSQ